MWKNNQNHYLNPYLDNYIKSNLIFSDTKHQQFYKIEDFTDTFTTLEIFGLKLPVAFNLTFWNYLHLSDFLNFKHCPHVEVPRLLPLVCVYQASFRSTLTSFFQVHSKLHIQSVVESHILEKLDSGHKSRCVLTQSQFLP